MKMNSDMEDFLKEKGERYAARFAPPPDSDAGVPIESLHQHKKHHHHHNRAQKRSRDLNIADSNIEPYVYEFSRDYDVNPPSWQGQIE